MKRFKIWLLNKMIDSLIRQQIKAESEVADIGVRLDNLFNELQRVGG